MPTTSVKWGLKRRAAALLFPRYSRFLDRLNWHARWAATVKAAGNIPLFETRRDLHKFVQKRVAGTIDYMEFGVFRGETLRWWCMANVDANSRFFGFDSFEGLPEDWSAKFPKGTFRMEGAPPKIEDSRLQFVIGWFQESLPAFLATYDLRECPIVIHCDSALYSSALFCLTSLNRLIRPGTIIIFDELRNVLSEYRALTDYATAYRRQWRFIAATEDFDQVAVEMN